MLLASSGVSGSSSKTYIDDLFSVQLRTGNGSTQSITTGFQPDLIWTKSRSATTGHHLVDSTRGAGNSLESNSTRQQQSEATGITAFSSSGYSLGADSDYNKSGATYVDWCWKKAPEFFDVVTYTGSGVARTVNHNLGAVPELIIVKGCTGTYGAGDWICYHAALGNVAYIDLNFNIAVTTFRTEWNNTTPTSTVFSLDSSNGVNNSATTYVAYLFASIPGISKVGSYTGNGSSQTINCGFAAGARFILIKCTDSTGDWHVWSSATGIIAANDPHLSLNTTAAEVTTDDSVDPDSTGFIVNQVAATNINVTSASYIYLAIA